MVAGGLDVVGHQAGLENCLVVMGKVEASFPLQKKELICLLKGT